MDKNWTFGGLKELTSYYIVAYMYGIWLPEDHLFSLMVYDLLRQEIWNSR